MEDGMMARHMTIEQLSYDGIVIDKIWVGYSSFRILPGCEDIPYVQTWKQVLKKRTILTLIWVIGAVIVAGVVVPVF